MKSIGIVGAGVAGLHLGLRLQAAGVPTTLYAENSPDEIRAGRLPSLVARFAPMRARERALGIRCWDYPDFGMSGIELYVGGSRAIRWKGSFREPASGVDMRIYHATLLEAFAERGGAVVLGALDASDVERLAARHELMVVCSGRGTLCEMFPRDAQRSPYTTPQRWLVGAFYRGIRLPQELRVIYTVSPGNGEIFQSPFTSFDGHVSCILIEGTFGGAFEPLRGLRYEADPAAFEAMVASLVRQHAPPIHENIDAQQLRVTRPLDVVAGAITPTARRGYAPLGGGKFALALGDAHVATDPILAQGANSAARQADRLAELLLGEPRIDEAFCRDADGLLWEAARSGAEWTNAMLGPPPPHVIELFLAASRNRAIADEVSDNFGWPEKNWPIFRSPEGTAACLARHGMAAAPPPASPVSA